MTKKKSSYSSLVESWFKTIPQQRCNFNIAAAGKVYCIPCEKHFEWNRISQLTQHIPTKIHQKNLMLQKASGLRQTQLSDSNNRRNEFNEDICRAFLAADIPFQKLQHPAFSGFIEKWCNRPCPDESTMRKTYVKPVYEEAIKNLRAEIGDSPIFMQIDETTDKKGRLVANVIVGALRPDRPSKPHLLMVRQLSANNNSTITQLVLEAIGFLWPLLPQKEVSNRFLVLLTDMATSMVRAGKNLRKTYPKLVHVTCLAHALNRVSETVRFSFPEVYKMISNIKAVFKKAPSRVAAYKDKYPNLALPPEAVLTRWGTWIRAADFAAMHYEEIKSVIMEFNPKEAESIRHLHQLFEKPELVARITELSANFSIIATIIEKLESRRLTIFETLDLMDELSTALNDAVSSHSSEVVSKFEEVLRKNPGLEQIRQLAAVQRGEGVESQYSPSEMAKLKYCPLTSVEVERSFSITKAMLRDNRQNFLFENFEMYAVCNYEMSG